MTYDTSSFGNIGGNASYITVAKTANEQQLVFRLLSHELYRYLPSHPHAHEFKSCPEYIKDLLHQHCEGIQAIQFDDREERQCKIFHSMLRLDNGWVNLSLLLSIFPNVRQINYSTINDNKDISFWQHVIPTIATYFKINTQTSLKFIVIYLRPIENVIKQMVIKLNKYNSFIQQDWKMITNNMWTPEYLQGTVRLRIVPT
eukprot:74960_1